MLLKLLGALDMLSGLTFLVLVFGMTPPLQLMLFCAGLLFLKGLFIMTGDVLSIIDLISSIVLLLAIIWTLPALLLWTPAFLLIAKAIVSFI